MEMSHSFPAATPALEDREFCHPDRPTPKWRPLKALQHFRALLRDKEDTAQVFHIFECLPRMKYRDEAKAFWGSEQGKHVRATEPYLPDILDDHDRLRAMPAGSVAHAYIDFMTNEGLSAAGLVEESHRFQPRRFHDQIEFYANRGRDTHDLLHVLTGYGRDGLGESCVLAFTYGQSPAPGHLFIAWLSALNIKKIGKTPVPVLKAVAQAQAMGKGCRRVSEMAILDLLAMPLSDARALLNISAPTHYHECHRIWRSVGIDPYGVLNQEPQPAA
jgi:ubiquinone biosynthesis protein COQ4